MYVSNTGVISRPLPHRPETYQCADAYSQIAVALQVLGYVRSSPECWNPRRLNVRKLRPPAPTRNRPNLRRGRDTRLGWETGRWANEGPCASLNAQAGVAEIDKIGVTVVPISSGRYTLYCAGGGHW